MSFVSRGFQGRRREDADPARVPPGQYVTRTSRSSRQGRRPARRSTAGISRSGPRSTSRALDVGGVQGAAERDRHGRHPLRDEVVEARHDLDGRLARHPARRRRHERRVRRSRSATAATRRTCRSKTSPAARPGSPTSTTASRSIPSTAGRRGYSCRTCTSGRAPSGCAGSSCETDDEPGFWEGYGYHNYGDPWQEQRYWGD